MGVWKVRQDLTGRKFTRLLVKQCLGIGTSGCAQWLCLCDCGNFKVILSGYLLQGQSKSCGCFNRDQNRIKQTTHGQYGTRAYKSWYSMLQRCGNKNNKAYKNYGGRGIRVCRRWKKFENFYSDMGDPDPGMSLDRKKVHDHYKPTNCRWVSDITQANNRRNNFRIRWKGKERTLAEWSREVGIKSSIIRRRIVDLGWLPKDAMTIPARKFSK
jgi:hypothetical protein